MNNGFAIEVSYGQILVHIASHPKPGLLWSDAHVAQGFAWSDGIVSFSLPDHDGECLIDVVKSDSGELEADILWAVQVPFDVTEALMIGTVFDMRPVNMPIGRYNVIFEVRPGVDEFAFRINVKFTRTDTPSYAILRQGGELSTEVVLRKRAELAG